jgi:hypothetical protein
VEYVEFRAAEPSVLRMLLRVCCGFFANLLRIRCESIAAVPRICCGTVVDSLRVEEFNREDREDRKGDAKLIGKEMATPDSVSGETAWPFSSAWLVVYMAILSVFDGWGEAMVGGPRSNCFCGEVGSRFFERRTARSLIAVPVLRSAGEYRCDREGCQLLFVL